MPEGIVVYQPKVPHPAVTWLVQDQPLIPTADIPWRKYLWKVKKMMAIGMVVNRLAAMSVFHGLVSPNAPRRRASPTGSVRISGLLGAASRDWRNSFHTPYTLKMVSAMRPGLTKGSITRL